MSGAPLATLSPALTITATTVPDIGAVRCPPCASSSPACASGSTIASVQCPSRVNTWRSSPRRTTVAVDSAPFVAMTRRPSRSIARAATSPSGNRARQPAPSRESATMCRASPSANVNATACSALFSHHGSTTCHGECGSPDARAASARSPTSVRTSSSAAASSTVAGAGDRGGNSAAWWRAMSPVSTLPVANASCMTTRRRNATLVATPTIS